MVPLACEVAVVGAGVAGSTLAYLLAEAGASVLLIERPSLGQRSVEVLPPGGRRLLKSLGLNEPSTSSRACRGSVSCWYEGEPVFTDFALMHCLEGLAYRHQALASTIRDRAVAAGAELRFCTAAYVQGIGELTVDGLPIRVGWIVDATGRTGQGCRMVGVRRQRVQRLVALSCGVRRALLDDCLVLGAAQGGWWYLPPRVDERDELVFLTSPELLPGASQRRDWFQLQVTSSGALALVEGALAEGSGISGVDASVCVTTPVAAPGWVSLGDAALAPDPVSGQGTTWALEAAVQLAIGLCANPSKVAGSARAFMEERLAVHLETRAQVYADAAARFQGSPFWSTANLVAG